MSSQSSTGMALPAFILEAEGMGRERRGRRFHLGDSEHGKRGGRWSAMSGHCCLHESSWGGLLRQRNGRAPVGVGRGGSVGAYQGLESGGEWPEEGA